MNKCLIRLAKVEDIEKIQLLSQELIEYKKSNVVCLKEKNVLNY